MPVKNISPKRRSNGVSTLGAFFGVPSAGILALFSFVIPLWQAPAHAAPKPAERPSIAHKGNTKSDAPKTKPHLSLQDRLALAEKQLKNAKNNIEMEQAWAHTESLRQHSLTGATRLLADESTQQAKAGELQKAVEALNAAIALQPDNGLLRRNRAELRFAGNDPMGAVQDLALTLKADPGDVIAWAILAKVEESLHNPQEALTAFQNALSHAPRFPNGKELLKHFQKNASGQAD